MPTTPRLILPLLLAAAQAGAVDHDPRIDLCRRAVAHRPAADVTFAPGIDVRGRPVAPADLPGSPAISLPDTFDATVEVDLLDDDLRPDDLGDLDVTLLAGNLTIGPGGQARFNGQPLTADDEAAVEAACRAFLE
jgi:hypothetical protein